MAIICVMTILLSGLTSLTWDPADVYENTMDYYDSSEMEISSWANGNQFGCDWSKDNVEFDSGIMQLKLTEKNTKKDYPYLYSGAEYRTRNTYGYGLYLVDMKPAKNDGIVSSFFTYTGPSAGTQWDEIDIEFLGKDTTQVQFNFFTDGQGKHEYIYDLGFDASEEFHEYGFLWTDNHIIWFVDGQAAYYVSSSDYDLPTTESKIMMNLWNGADTEKTNAWLNEYDGTTDLIAYYDDFEYVPWDSISFALNDEEESTEETPIEYDLTDLLATDYSQYVVKNKNDDKQISSQKASYTEDAYLYSKLAEPLVDPEELSIDLYYQNGYMVSITPSLIDEAGEEYFLDNSTIINEKGEHSLNYDIEGICHDVEEVRLYLNSENEYIKKESNSYCVIKITDFTISN